jgi:DNA repair photolyase
MDVLAEQDIHTGIAMMPVLPFIEDDEENIRRIVEQAHAHGAAYILPWFGMSLRDRQRAYYYDKLDRLFPGLRDRYEQTFGNQYHCAVPNADRLTEVFQELCGGYGIATRMKRYEPAAGTQMKLF